MKRILRGGAVSLVVILLIFGIVPLVIPIPPVPGAVPPSSLADADSLFIDVNGLRVHVKKAGQGEPVMVLLHGFGASLFSWREVMQPLSQTGTVIAFDRPGFGLTSRPLDGDWTETNPYSPEAQVDLVIGLLDAFQAEQAVLIGNSAGGTVALNTALAHPERVETLVLVDAAVYNGGGAPAWTRALFNIPQVNRLAPWILRQVFPAQGDAFIRTAWHDPARVSPEILAGYREPLQVADWDRAFWEFTRASRTSELASRLAEIRQPVLVVTGDDDRIVPTSDSVRLAEEMKAPLEIFRNCGHLPQEECPGDFIPAVTRFIEDNRP